MITVKMRPVCENINYPQHFVFHFLLRVYTFVKNIIETENPEEKLYPFLF